MSIGHVTCPRCSGIGTVAKAGMCLQVECNSCGGKGRITYADASLTEEDKRILALEDEVRRLREQLLEAERRATSWSLSYQKLLDRVKGAIRRSLPEGGVWGRAAETAIEAIDQDITGKAA